MKPLRIVFMGTPDFAVGILNTILNENKYEVVGVVTAPDKPAGRGQKIKYSAVKEYALQKGLHILQPVNLKSHDFLDQLQALQANVQVVVAFRMLPAVVWQMPALGTFNLHASLLPEYRGAAPINWAIINGETQTGVTTFFIDDKIDTGAIIMSKNLPIAPTDNAGALHDKLMHLGSQTVIETLDLIATNQVIPQVQQENSKIKTAYKLDKNNCKIDFTKNVEAIYNLIRGLSPYPAAYCYFKEGEQEWNVKIYEATLEKQAHTLNPGTIVCSKKEIKIAATGGYLNVTDLQFPGKKRMSAKELLNGITLSDTIKAV